MNYLSQLEEYIGFRCSTVRSFTADRVGFTEFINRMHACSVGNSSVDTDEICSCDLGTGGWSHTEERYNSVKFLVPFIHDSMQTITHVSNTNRAQDGAFFLVAFAPGVWLASLGLTIAFIILKLVDVKFAPILPVQQSNSNSCVGKLWDRVKQRLKRWRSAGRSVGKFYETNEVLNFKFDL